MDLREKLVSYNKSEIRKQSYSFLNFLINCEFYDVFFDKIKESSIKFNSPVSF